MSSIIEDLIARKIFNNRGEETIEVDVITTAGFGRASAPAGKSRGKAEVIYYPTGGVDAAIKKLDEQIAPELAGLNADFQEEIDTSLHEIDGTTNFKNIGGNTAFAISLANAEAAANSCPGADWAGGCGAAGDPGPPCCAKPMKQSTTNTSMSAVNDFFSINSPRDSQPDGLLESVVNCPMGCPGCQEASKSRLLGRVSSKPVRVTGFSRRLKRRGLDESH